MQTIIDKILWWLKPTRKEHTLWGGEVRYKNWKGQRKVVSWKAGDPQSKEHICYIWREKKDDL